MNPQDVLIVREPENAIMLRCGHVLGKKTILKSDHFPGCQNKKLRPNVPGAPNYRQVVSLPIYGVAIPTIEGILNVLNLIGANKKVLWYNLREEPVIYINGRPFVLREVERPFSNLEYTGINRIRLEDMEARLKTDVLKEASRYANKILVCDEKPDGQMFDQWENVSEFSVQTPLEVYERLATEGYKVEYERLPITDEKAPKETDFDLLVEHMSKVDSDTACVFNCQMGRGRTTTGMVIATITHLRRTGLAGIQRTLSSGLILEYSEDAIEEVPDSEESLRRGEYTVIRSLIRVLEGGCEAKRQLDTIIDKCSAMQNLREAIAVYRNSILKQSDEKKREEALSFFVAYLERYYFLICFAVYIYTEQSILSNGNAGRDSFHLWMKARPELYSILRRLLRRDPMGALGYRNSPPGLIKRTTSNDDTRPYNMEAIVATRSGAVLGRQTILKSDHFPGCQNSNLPDRVEGAPNFRGVPGFPVYGVANPTIDGIRTVLDRVADGNQQKPILWHNMREEPVIYINGKPFVLREVERPFKNMLEYTGIDRERVEQMERRLKEDILKEAELYDGAIMVNHETEDGQIFDSWESVNAEVVQTSLEVYDCLQAEGFCVNYARVPITDGKAPKSSDFDKLASNIASAAPDIVCVFNCQMGRGRTTTGTVIACLIKLRCNLGRPLKLPSFLFKKPDIGSRGVTIDEDGDIVFGMPGQKVEQEPFVVPLIDDIPIVRRITRSLENGSESRAILDVVIDHCAAMQNLRQAVLYYRKVFNQQDLDNHVRRGALSRGMEYLDRYFMMITFTSYLGSEAFDGYCQPGCTGMPFRAWLRRWPEIRQMKWGMHLRSAQFFTIPEITLRTLTGYAEGDEAMETSIKSRNGAVLEKHSILKMYFFPGQKETSSHTDIPGAPHVCQTDGFPIHSMATPTIHGAKAVFAHLKSEHMLDNIHCQKTVITDLREEVVVYINDNPFVLREIDQPASTLKHTGISGTAVEQMEERLKEDILAEAARLGGRMVLHREEYNPVTNQSDTLGYWETITSESVMTPAEMYKDLSSQGFNIDYKRIPLTRERTPLACDLDAIQRRLDRTSQEVEYIFVSHTGFGGVAYAMAIAYLRLKVDAQLATLSPSILRASLALKSDSRDISRPPDDHEAFKEGDYRDILSLARVLPNGPACKAEVDAVIDKCAEAGHLRNDIFYYKQEVESLEETDEDQKDFLYDMGVKALRRYFFLISFRSYLDTQIVRDDPQLIGEQDFSSWMQARPELGHLCDNLKLE